MISVTLAVLVEDAWYRQFLMAPISLLFFYFIFHVYYKLLLCVHMLSSGVPPHTHFHFRLHIHRLALQPPYLLCYLIDCLEDCFIKSQGRLAERGEGLLLLSETTEANLKKQNKTC